MYAVKVQLADRPDTEDALAASSSSSYAAALAGPRQSGGSEQALEEAVDVWTGNPRVEHLVGQVHLYRCQEPGQGAPSLDLPGQRSPTVCVLSLPLDLSVSDFCAFLGGYLQHVKQMRFMQREGARAPCLVVLTMDEQEPADHFFRDFNSRPFSSLEPEDICHVGFVRDVVVAEGPSSEPERPVPGQVELPSCPVCLEHLDESVGIVTTVCNHRFHNLCLQRWADTSCPVCRYVANADASSSHCEVCGSSQDVWICLICGHVGCGRYREGHAVDHWRASGHAYSLELRSQRVWDYAGDGYVHRLVQSKTGGKLVEVPSPEAPGGSHCEGSTEDAQAQSQLESALLSSKLDAVALEFNHLLVSQLDSQRHYYEGLLAQRQEAALAESAAAKASQAATSAGAVNQREALLRAEQARKAAEQRAAAASAQSKAVARERDDLRALNEQVLRNQAALRQQVASLQATQGSEAAHIKDLEEQLRDLMLFIEAQQQVAANSELQGGGASAPAPVPAKEKRKASKGRR